MPDPTPEPTKLRPPLVVLLLLIIAGVLTWQLDLPVLVPVWARIAGGALAVVGLVLNVVTERNFRSHGTPIDVAKRPTALMTTGPFARSRNPVYLAVLLLLLGIGVAVGTWPFLVIPVLVWIMLAAFHVPREEAILAAEFGEAYGQYRAKVPRWVGRVR